MRAYLSIGRLRFLLGMQYRTAAIAGVMTQLFFGFLFIMIYVAFYSHSTVTPPLTIHQLAAYIWLQQAFLSFIALWFRDNELFQLITGGNLAYELCRPCGLYPFWYAKLLAQRLSSGLLRCLPILLIAGLLPQPYRMSLPPTPVALLLFIATLLLGLLVLVSISMLIYLSVFWTMSPAGSTLMIAITGEFFAGMMIPVPLMPHWLQQVTNALPFRWTVDFPFRVYSGQIGTDGALTGILVQAFWLLVVVGIGLGLQRRALRRIIIQGG